MAENFNINPNDEVENFVLQFGELTYIVNKDFDKLDNRPSYNGTVMTHETNIPKVPSNVSELTNDANYQTATNVSNSISAHNESEDAHSYIQGLIGQKQDTLTAGNGISINSGSVISVNTTVVATQQNLSDEVTNRENSDIYLQQQIDGISASSDVVDIVGTYAELQAYDTQHLKDNDIIKVLQDETQGGATTYYRWSITTETFTLIGQEGPYYTKASADAQFVPQTRTINSKALSSNIVLTASDVSALSAYDIAQTTGYSTSQIMSQKATTDALDTLHDLLDGMPSDFFSGAATELAEGASITLTTPLELKSIGFEGNTTQQDTPAPSPDHPQNVEIVTGSQVINVCGKNLVDTSAATVGYIVRAADGELRENANYSASDWIPVKAGEQYYQSNSDTWYSCYYDSSKNFLAQINNNLITPSQDGYIRISWNNENTNSVMVEHGSSATEYEPYQGNSYALDLGNIEMCKIGSYQDKIYQDGNGDWYLHKDIGNHTFDGSENWQLSGTDRLVLARTTIGAKGSTDNLFSNIAVPNYNYGANNNECYIGGSNIIFSKMYYNGSLITSTSSWTTYLANNNSPFYFPLATATDTQITDATLVSQLEALASATMYDGTTTLASTSENLPVIINVETLKKTLNGIVSLLTE